MNEDDDISINDQEFIAKLKAEIALPKYQDNVFSFDVECTRAIKRHCNVGDELKVFDASDNKEIYFYLKGLNEFDSYVGTLPEKYYSSTLYHLRNDSIVGVSWSIPLLPFDNHSAIIKHKSFLFPTMTIEVRLYNLELRRVISEMAYEYQKPFVQDKVRNTLNKFYTMRKPVRIRFYIMSNMIHKLKGDLSLKVFDKEHYINNCGEYEIQLLNDKLEVIAKAGTSGQEALLLRVIKAHYNGQKLSIQSVENQYSDTTHLDKAKPEEKIDYKETYGDIMGGAISNLVKSFDRYSSGSKHYECPIYLTISAHY
jgi:hypothetical protein